MLIDNTEHIQTTTSRLQTNTTWSTCAIYRSTVWKKSGAQIVGNYMKCTHLLPCSYWVYIFHSVLKQCPLVCNIVMQEVPGGGQPCSLKVQSLEYTRSHSSASLKHLLSTFAPMAPCQCPMTLHRAPPNTCSAHSLPHAPVHSWNRPQIPQCETITNFIHTASDSAMLLRVTHRHCHSSPEVQHTTG